MTKLLVRVLILSLVALTALPNVFAADSLSKNSQINPDDTYVTFDETTARQAMFDLSKSESSLPGITAGKQRSSTRESKFHIEEGYDINGQLVLDIAFVSSALAYKTAISEARFSDGKVEFFDSTGALVHSKFGAAQYASALSPVSGVSLSEGPAIQDIQAYAKAASATIVGDMPPTDGPGNVTLRMLNRASGGGSLTKTFVRSSEGWVLSQLTVSRPIANGGTTIVTSFSNVQWHQNVEKNAVRKSTGASHRARALPRYTSSVGATRASHPAARTPQTAIPSSCTTTVTNLGGSQNVVFQHGIFSNSCAWSNSTYPMTTVLNGLLSFKTEIVPSLDSTDSLASQTSALISQLQTTGGSHYVLIGHSQGGLISRSAAQYFQTNSPSTVTGVITVDTPNQGAALIENGIGAASQLGSYLNLSTDAIESVFDCYDDNGDFGPFCTVGCGDPNGGALVCGLMLAGTGADSNIINDAIDAAGLFVLNTAFPATIDLEPGSAFLTTLNSYSENFVRVGIVSNSEYTSDGPFLPEHMGGDLIGGTGVGQATVEVLTDADVLLNLVIASIEECEADPDCDDCDDFYSEQCYNDDAYIDAYAAIDSYLFVPDQYWDPLPIPNECVTCDFSDGVVNGQSQYYPPESTVPQYVIYGNGTGADTHFGSTKSAFVAEALVAALERYFFVPALGCTYTLSPTSVTEAASGGKGTFTVTTAAGCVWSVASNASWLTFTPANGTGSGTITYTIAANTGGARVGSLTVAGIAVFSVMQDGVTPETLTVTLSGGGTVTSSPEGIACPGKCSAAFTSGTKVKLTALAGLGYKFTAWSGACTGDDPNVSRVTGAIFVPLGCSITMDSAESVTATFTAQPAQTLTVSVTGSGTVTSSPSGISCPGTCSAAFTYGTPVSLSASPASKYIFAGWGGACGGTGACALTMTTAKSVSGGFDEVTPGIISTVAGDSTEGYSGDGGLATSAEISVFATAVLDSAGNIYIGDWENCRIRAVNMRTTAVTIAKVVIQPGDIATVAGNGTCGYSGDGGAATSAEMHYPEIGAVDAAGNIYFADEDNNRIRKVTASTGIITTVAGNGTAGYSGDGGPGTSAELNTPLRPALDSADNIYFADFDNNRVRAVNTGTKAVTIFGVLIQPGDIATVAGDGTAGYSGDGGAATSAELYGPEDVAVDSANNIYIADFDNERVRKVTASTSKISTVAGDGTELYSGDGGPATSAAVNPVAVAVDSAGDIYISDFINSRIREVTASTGIISTVAGDGIVGQEGDGIAATSVELWGPYGVVVNSAGDFYIADTARVRVVKP
jgi:pimeloyl-ACP methyl ester carboxylesterase